MASPIPELDLVTSGEIDMLAVGRSLIANPAWVRIVRDHGWEQLRPYSRDMLQTLSD